MLIVFYPYAVCLCSLTALFAPVWLFYRKISWPRFLTAFAAFYLLMLLAVWLYEMQLQAEYDSLTGGQEFFNHTAESLAAMQRLTSDTGRRLAPFTLLPAGLVDTCGTALIAAVCRKIRHLATRKRKAV